MIRLTICVLALALAPLGGGVAAQTLTTNAQGQRVIVYPDGRTRLFDDPGVGADAAPPDAPDAPAPDAPAPDAPGVTDQRRTTLPSQTTPAQEADAKLEVRRRVARLSEEREALTRIAKKARSREAKLANRLRKLRDSRRVSDRAQVEIVNQQLLEARETTRTAEDGAASVETRADALRETLGMSIAERAVYLDGLGLGYLLADAASGSPAATDLPPAGAATAGTATAQRSSPEALATAAATAPAREFAAYDRRRDTKFTPPAPTCTRAFDGLDEFTNKRRVVLEEETFFTYTSPDLKPFLKDASLITCNARLLRTGKTILLETTFVIRSQFAAKEFGVLPKGSQMTFRSVAGQQLSLKNQVQSQAEYDPVAKVSTYKGRYLLSRGAQRFLEDALLDEVRVMWGTGFDDYAVYDLTFLQRQLDCI